MAKSIKLKCTNSFVKNFFEAGNMYKGRVKEDGQIQVKDKYGVWFDLPSTLTMEATHAPGTDQEKSGVVKFVELKTKTLKCIALDHSNGIKKTFKPGKRYQVDTGRALGGVAGYIFDADGCPWTLYREEVGFSIADGTTFEAKYL